MMEIIKFFIYFYLTLEFQILEKTLATNSNNPYICQPDAKTLHFTNFDFLN